MAVVRKNARRAAVMLGDSWIGVVFPSRAVMGVMAMGGLGGGQVLACLAYGDACVAGGGADVGGRGVVGVLPEVIGLPPGDLLQQVRLGSPVERRRDQDRVLELVVLPAAERGFGQEPLPQAFQLQRVDAADPAPVQ